MQSTYLFICTIKNGKKKIELDFSAPRVGQRAIVQIDRLIKLKLDKYVSRELFMQAMFIKLENGKKFNSYLEE